MTRQRNAFTLLETILAVALSALLVGLVAAGMRMYTNVVADRRADVTNAQVARVILQRIAADIRSAYQAPEEEEPATTSLDDGTEGTDDGTGTGTDDTSTTETDPTVDLTNTTAQTVPGLYGNTIELQIDVLGSFAQPIRYDSLIASGIDPLSANLLSDPKVVTYYVRSADDAELAGTPLEPVEQSSSDSRKMVLVRRVQSRSAALFESTYGTAAVGGSGEQLLSDQVVSIEFAYHDGYDWTDSWDSSTMGLPIMVSVTLAVTDVASAEESSTTAISDDDLYQVIVRIPAAEIPEDTTGI